MRHPPRRRHRAHVDQSLDLVELKELDQLVERPGGVADRQDDRSDGVTAGTRIRFTYVWPFMVKVPEKRNAGSK